MINVKEVYCMKCLLNKVCDLPDKELTIDIGVDHKEWLLKEKHIVTICEKTIKTTINSFAQKMNLKDNNISLLLTDDDKMRSLNKIYRNKNSSTNVLSFSSGHDPIIGTPYSLGDIALSYSIILGESDQFARTFVHHVQHLLVHGCLHLIGFSHEKPLQADLMEKQEISILYKLGISNPYER